MSGEFLSQDEVDALLRGVTGEEEVKGREEDDGGVRPYNLARQERIVRGRMPTMEIINDRFARLLRVGMFNFMRRSPEVSVGPVRVLKYSEFIRNLVVPTNINILQLKPLRGSMLMIFDPSLVFAVIDNLFGGDGRFHTRVEGRDFTPTEQRIIQRMLSVVLDEYQKSWQPVFNLSFDFVRSEMHTQFANIATPSEIVVAASFTMELGTAGGQIHICIPYSVVEPIRDLLYSTMQGDHIEPDKRWLRMLKSQVQLAEVVLSAKLATETVAVSQIMNLKVGDFIGLDIKPTIVAEVDSVPLFECRYGVMNSQYAIRVEKILAVSPKENALGEEHGQ